MTFFVSDALKDRVTEESLNEDVYHEWDDVDLFALFYNSTTLVARHAVESITRHSGKIDIKIDLGKSIKSIEYFLSSFVVEKFDILAEGIEKPIISLKNPNIELVKIKKANNRNSYFARIVIV